MLHRQLVSNSHAKGNRSQRRTQCQLILFFLCRRLEEGTVTIGIVDEKEERYKAIGEACNTSKKLLDDRHLGQNQGRPSSLSGVRLERMTIYSKQDGE